MDQNHEFVGTVWIDDFLAGYSVPADTLTGFAEDFDVAIDSAFWANLVVPGENNIFGAPENGAFKYVCNPNNSFWFGVWWDFGVYKNVFLDLRAHPYVSFKVMAEPGATYDGVPLDSVDIAFDTHDVEYFNIRISADGTWHEWFIKLDGSKGEYRKIEDLRFNPGIADLNVHQDHEFGGTVWIDDFRAGDKVKLPPTVVKGFEQDFNAELDTSFWANIVDENNILGTAEDGAFKYVCNPNNSYWFGVWWDFPTVKNIYLNLKENPYITFRVKAEPGATWDGTPIDSVELGFDTHDVEYFQFKIPADGKWYNWRIRLDASKPEYEAISELRFNPGIADINVHQDHEFRGTVWIDDFRAGDRVILPAVVPGYAEHFETPVNLDFWIPNKETHQDGTPVFTVLQLGGALKVWMKQKNYDDGQMYNFEKIGLMLNLSTNPRAIVKLKLEPGARLAGAEVDHVVFQMSPFDSYPSKRGGTTYPYSQQHSPVAVSVPADGEWHTWIFDWSTPDTQPAADGYVYPNNYSQISYLLLETVAAPDSLYEATFSVDDFLVGNATTGVKSQRAEVVTHFELLQNYPNPFNPITSLGYALPKTTHVTLIVFNIKGEKVATLVNREEERAGYHEIDFDGSNLSSGIYFYRLKTPDFAATKRMILMK